MKELVRRCISGDHTAWETFVDKYSRLVFHVIHKTLRARNLPYTAEDVEDIFESVFESLVEREFRLLKRFGEPFNLPAWLGIITRRHTNRYMTAHSKRSVSIEGAEDEISIRENLPDPAAGPEQIIQKREMEEILVTLIRELPERDRIIIRLFYYEDMPHSEISKMVGVSVNTVGKALFRTREKLRENLMKRFK